MADQPPETYPFGEVRLDDGLTVWRGAKPAKPRTAVRVGDYASDGGPKATAQPRGVSW